MRLKLWCGGATVASAHRERQMKIVSYALVWLRLTVVADLNAPRLLLTIFGIFMARSRTFWVEGSAFGFDRVHARLPRKCVNASESINTIIGSIVSIYTRRQHKSVHFRFDHMPQTSAATRCARAHTRTHAQTFLSVSFWIRGIVRVVHC